MIEEERKKELGRKANKYAKLHYKSILMRLDKNTFAEFEALRNEINESRPGLLKKLMAVYKAHKEDL